jgi:dipeptidyl-peptidase-4
MFKYIIISGLLLFSGLVQSQQKTVKKQLTIEDAELGFSKGLYPTNLRNLQWVVGGNSYSFIQGDSIWIRPALLSSKMPERVIGLEDLRKVCPTLKRMPNIEWKDKENFFFYSGNELYQYEVSSEKGGKLLGYPKDAEHLTYQSAINVMAYTRDNNLYLANEKSEQIIVFESKDPNIVSGQSIARSEFGITNGIFWSPKGGYLAFYQKDETNVADYPLLDITTTPGSLRNIKYPMAGQPSEHAKVGIYNLGAQKTIFLQTGEPLDHYLTNLTWSPDERFVFLAEVNREQNRMWFNQYDVQTGKLVKTLFEETANEWVEPEHPAYFIPGKNDEFLWLSERDGYMNLYWYNLTGKLMGTVTRFDYPITDLHSFSPDGKFVYVSATGKDARERHLFKIEIARSFAQQLTRSNGSHQVLISDNGTYVIDNWSSLQVPRKIEIYSTNADSKGTHVILEAPNPLSAYSIGTTEFVDLKAEDGTTLYARLIKPSHFDSKKKYPVLVYVYGGPHAQMVTNNWLGGARLWMHYLAEQGYLVFSLDNRGSAHRGYNFEKVIHRNLGFHEMKDQLVGVDYLKKLPYVDANRMAVHGWSYGGFMTTSLMLRYPDVFKVGVAGGPVIDWKWYEAMYGERYMDTPAENPKGYEATSTLRYVNQLKGKLLMVHGTVDDVVVMQHNYAFVKECVEQGVQIDFFPYPMHAHNVYGKDRVHLTTKMLNYIMHNL